jgi:hypothetical protein
LIQIITFRDCLDSQELKEKREGLVPEDSKESLEYLVKVCKDFLEHRVVKENQERLEIRVNQEEMVGMGNLEMMDIPEETDPMEPQE